MKISLKSDLLQWLKKRGRLRTDLLGFFYWFPLIGLMENELSN